MLLVKPNAIYLRQRIDLSHVSLSGLDLLATVVSSRAWTTTGENSLHMDGAQLDT